VTTHAPPRPLLFLLAFGSGFAVMAIEIAGARVMAPTYGLSAVPWTAVIGVILTALAVGNHLGGRLADRRSPHLPWILAGAGLSAGLPILLQGLPGWALGTVGFIPGAVLSALLLFSLPVLALGMVVPWLIRMGTASVETVGRRAGDVGAAATAGSIVGTFVTGFVLIPLFPLPILLAVTAGGLLALAGVAAMIVGKGPSASTLGAGVVAMLLLGSVGGAADPRILHREQTPHGSIQVTETEWDDGRTVREMWQNGASSSAEVVATGRPAHRYVLDSVELLDALGLGGERTLVLGGGALTLPLEITRRWPEAEVEVVEIDPAATRLARAYFAFGDRDPEARPTVIHGEARRFLASSTDRYDVIYLDVFDHLVTVPWTLVTVEALTLARARLEEGGVMVANVLSPVEGRGTAFLERALATFEEVFDEVVAVPVGAPDAPTGATINVVVVAGEGPFELLDLPRLEGVGAAGAPLTDAHAPVEYLQARVFLEGLRW